MTEQKFIRTKKLRIWSAGKRILTQATPHSKYQMWGPARKAMRHLGEFSSIKEAEWALNRLEEVHPDDEIPEEVRE